MAIAIATVANSIESLSVTGLTIYDVDNIPTAVDTREKAALVPLPDYITNISFERDSFNVISAGVNVAKWTLTYTLHYRLFYKLAGSGRAVQVEYYDGVIDMIAAIWDAILAINTYSGGIDILPSGVFGIGFVQDASNVSFLGCDLAFTCQEFIN